MAQYHEQSRKAFGGAKKTCLDEEGATETFRLDVRSRRDIDNFNLLNKNE